MSSLVALDTASRARSIPLPPAATRISRKNTSVVASRSETFGGIAAELVTCESRQSNEIEITAAAHCLLMRCEGVASRCEIEWLADGRRQRLGDLKPGSVLFVPATSEVRVSKRDQGRYEYIIVQIPPSTLEGLNDVDLETTRLTMTPQAGSGEAELCRVLWAMRGEIKDPGAAGRLYKEALAVQLLVQLLRCAANLAKAPALAKGGLSPRQLRRAVEFLDADLTATPSLHALAEHVGLSATYFCTAFKRSTGMPPHRFLINRRIAYAKSLMADPRLSLTEVALSSGFGGSSQFATAFRQIEGTTPSSYRRSL